MDEAINETGTVMAPVVEDNGEQLRAAEQKLCKEVKDVLEFLLEVHGLPPGQKGEGIIRVIYENLNSFHPTLSRNDKLDKARQVINDLQVDVVLGVVSKSGRIISSFWLLHTPMEDL
jgi:hypothetical protein